MRENFNFFKTSRNLLKIKWNIDIDSNDEILNCNYIKTDCNSPCLKYPDKL